MTRISQDKYKELKRLASNTKDRTISSLIRDIIHNQKIQVYTHDETKDLIMEELASLRGEIKAIGININQIIRFFNTYPEQQLKEFYAKTTFSEYLIIESKIDRLLETIKIGKTMVVSRNQGTAYLSKFCHWGNLETETLQKIAVDYMDRLGFGKQPYLVYRHDDAGHNHIHIVIIPSKPTVIVTMVLRF